MNDKIKLIGILTLIGLTGIWWLGDAKLNKGSQIKESEQELKELTDRFQKLENMAKDLGTLQHSFDSALNELDSLSINIPNHEDYVSILEQIRMIAEKQNVSVVSLSPKREDSFPAIKYKLVLTKKHIERFPVQVNLRGDYLTIGAFLEELMASPMEFNIGSFSLESEFDGHGRVLACALVLFTYIYSETV